MNHISPVNHPESPLSGSTVESMIDRAIELKTPYFAATDHGYLTSILKGYMYAKKKDIKFIAGVELYFKDNNCDITRNTPSEQIKYFKIVVHAMDQEAYQKIVKESSDTSKKKIMISENEYPLFTWKDLHNLSKYNITVCTSNIEGMVSKHLLVDRMDLSLKYYRRLKDIFKENFYPTIFPFKHDKYWNTMVKVKVGDKTVDIPAFDRIETDHYKSARAIELTRRNNKHKKLIAVYINKIRYSVDKKYQDIVRARLVNDFQDLPGGDIQTKANKMMMAFARRCGDEGRLLINNYSYYANKDDKIVQDMKLGEEKRIHQSQYMASTEDIKDYLNNALELTDSLIQTLNKNSYDWAKKFDNFELKYDYKLPKIEGDPKKLLVDTILRVGRMDWKNPVYVKQFREEFELLTNNGVINLIPYFLPIVDIYDFYKENGHLTGPARGSAGGFLISYLCGITHIDPIKYGLSSSRFLTMDRVQQGNLPDIDCDLESRVPLVGTDGNSGYLFNKYGNKAAQISTRTLLRIKSAILDANRFIKGKVEDEIAQLSKSLPTTPQGVNDHDFVFGYEDSNGDHVKGLLDKNDDLQKYALDRPEEWEIVKRALSLARQNGRHACAYLISDTAIEDTIPVFEIGGVKRVTQPEAKQCEWAGLIKYDFLVVSALKDINLCLKYIDKKRKKKPAIIGWCHPESDSIVCLKCDPDRIDDDSGQIDFISEGQRSEDWECQKCNKKLKDTVKLETGHFIHQHRDTYVWDLPEDEGVYKMLGDGKTESVFQLNTVSVTPFVTAIKPSNIIDCATITSLVRPGPLDYKDEETGRNMAQEYIFRKQGRSKGSLEILNELLPETSGVMVFQEQVTKIARELGQMDVISAENVRIGMGKKIPKLLNSLKPVFIKGATEKTNAEVAEEVWAMMATFARYGFNKSHAVAYSVISYACAFLKHHYKLEWWASVLSNAKDKEINEVFYKYVKDMVLPPDINTSTEQIEVDYNLGKIRNKLSMISGIGEKAAEKIIGGRPYTGIKDFIEKKVCGPTMAKKLIHVGALDSLFGEKYSLIEKMWKYETMVNQIVYENKILDYDTKISSAIGEKDTKRIKNNREKYITKGPKQPVVDNTYIGLTPKKDYLIKKSIFPIMNLDLQKVLDRDSKNPIIKGFGKKIVANSYGRDNRLLTGETLQQIDKYPVETNAYFCVAGYVMDASEFSFAGGSKKALKLTIDSSGYVSEKVLWPDFDTGVLSYPELLKKGCIAYFFYSKRPPPENKKDDTKIFDIMIEENSILS